MDDPIGVMRANGGLRSRAEIEAFDAALAADPTVARTVLAQIARDEDEPLRSAGRQVLG
jgi:hypothetical protein